MTNEMNRRQVLASAGTAIGTLLAGCNTSENQEETEINQITRTLDGETPNKIEPEEEETDSTFDSKESVFIKEGETKAIGNSEGFYILTVTNVENSSYANLQVSDGIPVEAVEGEQLNRLAYELTAENVVGPEEESLPDKPKGVEIGNLPESYGVCSYESGELGVKESQTLTVNGTEYSVENVAAGENGGFVRINGELEDFDEGYDAELSGKEVEIHMKEESNSTMEFEYGPEC